MMRRNRQLWLILLVFAVVFLVVPAPPILAQGGITLTYDFTISDGGWNVFSDCGGPVGHRVDGVGWRTDFRFCSDGNSYRNVAIYQNFGSLTISNVTVFWVSGGVGVHDPNPELNCGIFIGIYPSYSGVLTQNYTLGFPGTSPTTWTGSISGNSIFVQCPVGYRDQMNSDPGGEFTISKIVITAEGLPTPTPTPTPTSTPIYYTPIPQTPQPPETCTTPDTRSASFRPGQRWIFAGGADYAVPLPQQFLRLPPGGSALMSVNLSDAEYKLTVTYQSSGLGGGSFIASIGGQPYTISPPDSAEHTFETDPIHYPTGATTLELSKPATDSVDVTIKFVCLSAVQGSSSGAITTGGDKNDQCETCDPPLSITDIPGILNWILCNIRRLWTCYLLPILASILSFIGTIIKFILSFFAWIVRGIGDILNWIAGLISSAWGSITGWISNLFAGVNNDFHSSGIADDMNVAASRTRDLPTAIGNGISTLGGQLGQIFTNTGQGLGGFLNFIWRLISFGASAIAYVIGLVPLVIQSFVDGINSASTPPSGSPLCSNPASLAYYPCLGFYVLDNTIFAGPAGYLFPVLVGIIVFYNLVWIFTRIKEELSK